MLMVPFHTHVTVSPTWISVMAALARLVHEHEAVSPTWTGRVAGATLRGLVLGAADEDGIGGVVVDDGGVGEDLVRWR